MSPDELFAAAVAAELSGHFTRSSEGFLEWAGYWIMTDAELEAALRDDHEAFRLAPRQLSAPRVVLSRLMPVEALERGISSWPP